MIVIDPSKGGEDIGSSSNQLIEKDFNLLISEYIYDRLKSLGIDTKIIRVTDENLSFEDRKNRILNSYGDNSNVVSISNMLGSDKDVEIIYPLRSNDKLSKLINDNLEKRNINVSKYYQKRSESDTSKDFFDIQRDTGNIQTIVIKYGNAELEEDANKLKNNYKDYAEGVIEALAIYKGVPYSKDENETYIVQKGDSLYSISKKFNTTVNELKDLNNLSSNLLQIGQKLYVKSTISKNEYIVQKGDSLYSISKKFNTTVNELKDLNNLSSNLLQIGQRLLIPSTDIYVVQKGDSLYSIARKFNTTVEEIKRKNNLSSNLLQIGKQLKI